MVKIVRSIDKMAKFDVLVPTVCRASPCKSDYGGKPLPVSFTKKRP